jgi:catechol 2,3-dioxygenase-like lactoylglutathione lyase family enzyme
VHFCRSRRALRIARAARRGQGAGCAREEGPENVTASAHEGGNPFIPSPRGAIVSAVRGVGVLGGMSSVLAVCAACHSSPRAADAPTGPMPRPRITGIAAVRVFVTDVQKSHRFYGTVLGLSASSATTFPVGTRQRIELVPASTPVPASLLAGVVWATDDVARMRSYLVDHGVAAGPLAAGAQRFDLVDPEGHPVAFEAETPPQTPPRGPSEPISARLLHAGFVVHDPVALDRFYRDLLGFRLYWHGGMTESDTDWVEIQAPDGEDWIEYMLNVPLDAGHEDLGVMNHFALGVPTMPPTFEKLRARGYRTDDQPEIGRDGKWQFDIFDPDQTRVEFMEFAPARAPCCHPYEAAHPRGP